MTLKNQWARLFADSSPRIFLFFFALVLQLLASAVSGVGFSLYNGRYWIGAIPVWLVWFVVMFAIASPRMDMLFGPFRQTLKSSVVAIGAVLAVFGILEIAILGLVLPHSHLSKTSNLVVVLGQMKNGLTQCNDSSALQEQAAENLFKGKNPYANSNVITALVEYKGSFDRVTPLRTGTFAGTFPYPSEVQLKELWNQATIGTPYSPPEIESKMGYPAGFFLVPAPFLLMGIKDVRIIYVIFVLAGLVYSAWKVRPGKRLIFVFFAAVSLELWNSISNAETGSIVFPFLLIGWISAGRNRRLSAIMMGLAVAMKQIAWFYLPFYLIYLWRKSGTRPLAYAACVIAGIFLLFNGYFIALDPKLWFSSILSPMFDPMFPLGVGFVATVTGGLLNIHSSLPFGIAEGIVYICGIIWYTRNASRYPWTGPVLAVLPLFFAWRSLWTYFFYVQLIVMACLLTEEKPIVPAPDNKSMLRIAETPSS